MICFFGIMLRIPSETLEGGLKKRSFQPARHLARRSDPLARRFLLLGHRNLLLALRFLLLAGGFLLLARGNFALVGGFEVFL
jgi:hypothetical protein